MKRINISFYTLLFSGLGVIFLLVLLLYKAFPLQFTESMYMCQNFISNITSKLPFFSGILTLAILVILGLGIISFFLQILRTRHMLKKLLLKRISLNKRLNKIVKSLDLLDKVFLVKDRNLFSFCCGIFSPRIILTTGLLKSLKDQEIKAVLLHEQSHLIARDPLKVFLGKTFSSMFFFLPIFRELNKNLEAVNELLADQWTIHNQKTSVFLKAALKKVLTKPEVNLGFASNISGPEYFEIRIHRLINPGIKHKFRFSSIGLITTFLFFLVSLFFLQTPVNASRMDSKENLSHFSYLDSQFCMKDCHEQCLILTKPEQVYYTK